MAKTKDYKSAENVFDLLPISANIVLKNWKVFLAANILTILAALSHLIPSDSTANSDVTLNSVESFTGAQLDIFIGGIIFVAVTALVLYAYFYAAQTVTQVRTSRGESPTIKEVLSEGFQNLFGVVAVTFLSGAIIVGGLLLLIVPGIFAIARLAFAPYILIDQKLGVTDSMIESNRISKGKFGAVFAAILVVLLIVIGASILGGIPFIGQLAGAALTIAFSLVLPLRYLQVRDANRAGSKNKQTVAPPPTVK